MFSNVLEIDGYKIYYIETSKNPFKISIDILEGLKPEELVRVFYKNEYYEALAGDVLKHVYINRTNFIDKEYFN